MDASLYFTGGIHFVIVFRLVRDIVANHKTTRYAGAVTLKYKFRNRHFWSEGYYVSTVGLNEATVRKYIREQELHDQMKDKFSVKEYEDPFKGSK